MMMKKLIKSFQTKLKDQETKIKDLSSQVTKLAHVNLKLNADNKVLNDQMDQYDRRLYDIEKINSDFRTQNYELQLKN